MVRVLALLAPALLLACADGGTHVTSVSADECVSELKWTGGNAGSSRMRPGTECLGCHVSTGAPDLALGGTVYAAAGEPDDCFGVEGVTVEITDADGQSFTLTTNAAGNFYLSARATAFPVLPITARLIADGRERVKTSPVGSTACGGCHTAEGSPGRLTLP